MRGITAVVQACGSTEAGRVTMSGAEMQMQSFRKSKRNRIIQLIHIENTKCCSGNWQLFGNNNNYLFLEFNTVFFSIFQYHECYLLDFIYWFKNDLNK